MKVKIYSKFMPLKGAKGYGVDIYCFCPLIQKEINCSDKCIKCKNFRWFATIYVSCNYDNKSTYTHKKNILDFNYKIIGYESFANRGKDY